MSASPYRGRGCDVQTPSAAAVDGVDKTEMGLVSLIVIAAKMQKMQEMQRLACQRFKN